MGATLVVSLSVTKLIMAFNFHHIVAMLISLIISFGSFGISQKDEDLTKGASFIFGDSLVDAGNNNYLPTLSKANIAPNGIDFKASGGTPTGRYTNGRTIGDIVGTHNLLFLFSYINYIYFSIISSNSTIYTCLVCDRGDIRAATLRLAISRSKYYGESYLVRC